MLHTHQAKQELFLENIVQNGRHFYAGIAARICEICEKFTRMKNVVVQLQNTLFISNTVENLDKEHSYKNYTKKVKMRKFRSNAIKKKFTKFR